jgi:Flp pilus assembly protein TadG
MRQRLSRFIHSSSATAAIEFAFIVPIMVTMMAGVVECGRLFQVYNATNRIATQLAIVYADCTDTPVGTCGTEANSYMTSQFVANIVPQLTVSALSLQVFQVSMTGTTPTVVYAAPTGSTLSASQISAAQGALASGQSGVVVTATYTHTLQFFQTLMNAYLSSALTPSYTVVQLKG